MTHKPWLITFSLIACALLAACTSAQSTPAAEAHIANPASAYCVQNGGTVELRSDPSGAVAGVCIFQDGSECDEWAYSRGECKPGDSMATPVGNEGPAVFDDMYAAGMDWMDHLKTCSAYTQSYFHPLLQAQQVNIIKGDSEDGCVLSMETTGQFVIECRLDDAAIKVLTRDELYEQMRSQTFSGDTSDPSTEVINTQCKTTSLVTPQP